ncbi:hypothetical protein ACFYP4_08770 [Streptomyces sp. NPDC005551]|uniref:MmyB family transcriptional regulator n=1 Tax=unclassified Streptomyces TaxID=2593676 RepID=UPI0033D04BE0
MPRTCGLYGDGRRPTQLLIKRQLPGGEKCALSRVTPAPHRPFEERPVARPVQDKRSDPNALRHPLVGELELTYATLRAADDPDQALITHAT